MVDPPPPILNGEQELPNEKFDPNEQLYFRVRPDDDLLDVVTIDDIPSLPFSVNRGSLSQPEEVIVNHPNWGITGFPVEALPKTLISEPGNTRYEFRLVPKVEHGNKAHANIVCFKNGQEVKKSSQIAETIKLAFRDSLRKRAYWVRKPSTSSGN